jgi:hypothetical protein
MSDSSTPPDAIGVVIPTKRLRADGQRAALKDHDCRSVIEAKGDKWWPTLMRLVRPGVVVKIQRIHLLADPSSLRLPGGKYASVISRIEAIEAKGGAIMDVDRGWISTKKRDYSAMLKAAAISIKQGSREPTGRKAGRPTAGEALAKHRPVIEAEWHSRKHRTNFDAVFAMVQRGAPPTLTENIVWRAMKQWTGSGSSGRAPGPRK